MDSNKDFQSTLVLSEWQQLAKALAGNSATTLDGDHLDLATVIAVSRYNQSISLDKKVLPKLEESSQLLVEKLIQGHIIYALGHVLGRYQPSSRLSLNSFITVFLQSRKMTKEKFRKEPKKSILYSMKVRLQLQLCLWPGFGHQC